MKFVRGIYDYEGATEEELDFCEGDVMEVVNDDDPDWWYVRIGDEEGYVPTTYIATEEDEDNKEETRDDFSDIHAYESTAEKMESGPKIKVFAASTLAERWNKGSGRISAFLEPKLCRSGVLFEDMLLDPKNSTLRKRPTRTTLAFSILDGKNIQTTNTASTVILGRQVRIALFDGESLISNIHNVSAAAHPDFPTVWRFSSKASLLFPKDDENTLFIRTEASDLKLCILFEVGCTLRNEDEEIEETVGWGVLPLFTSDGGPIENKTYDVKIYDRNPFVSGGAKQRVESKFDKPPKLTLRVWKLGKSILEKLDHLPDNIISFLSAVPVFSAYRRTLAECRIKDNRLGPIFEPALSVFPLICVENDLLHLLVTLWENKERVIKKGGNLKTAFTECVVVVWPLLHVLDLPTFNPGNMKAIEIRRQSMQEYQERGVINYLCKNLRLRIKPFDTAELVHTL